MYDVKLLSPLMREKSENLDLVMWVIMRRIERNQNGNLQTNARLESQWPIGRQDKAEVGLHGVAEIVSYSTRPLVAEPLRAVAAK
jgi:hypothetical protein